MCVKYKLAFTLAETIMTLAIIGVVLTAAIPTMSTKLLSNNSHLKAYCTTHTEEARCKKLASNIFKECGSTMTSTCTDKNIVFGTNTPATFQEYKGSTLVDTTFRFTYNLATSPISLYNYFLSGKNLIRVGDYYMREQDSNFFLTRDVDANNNHIVPRGTRNTIVGSIKSANMTTATLTNNTIIGNNHNLDNSRVTLNNNVIYGINNTISGSGISNSIVYGGSNTVSMSNSLVIGSWNNTATNNSVIIANCINNPDKRIEVRSNCKNIPAGTNTVFSLGGVINSTTGTSINFVDKATISGTSFNGTFANRSDIRLKNIKGKYNKGLKEILQVKPVEFVYNNDNTATSQIGVIAQDIQKIFPEAVVKMPSGYLGVDSDPIFFAMLNALKEINEQKLSEEKRHEQLLIELEEIEKELKASGKKAKNTFISDIWNWLTNLISTIGGLLHA